eukprot:894101-Prymnesium_polylepis.1
MSTRAASAAALLNLRRVAVEEGWEDSEEDPDRGPAEGVSLRRPLQLRLAAVTSELDRGRARGGSSPSGGGH